MFVEVGDARVGDTIIEAGTEKEVEALPGYTEAISARDEPGLGMKLSWVQPNQLKWLVV